MVIKGASVEEVQDFFAQNPLITSGAATYRYSDFKVNQYQPILEKWVAQ